jgi:hypothetical protein
VPVNGVTEGNGFHCSRMSIRLTNTHSFFVFFDSFTTTPGGGESDLRTLYCAFAISAMLDDWSGVNVERALSFVASCRVRARVVLFTFGTVALTFVFDLTFG